MSDAVSWRPLAGSQVLLLAAKSIPDILIHGGRGFGKTETLLADFLSDVGMGFGDRWNGLFLRRNYPSLKDAMTKANRLIREAFPDARWNGSEHVWRFATGETLTFGYIDNLDHYESNYHGQEYQWIGGDELTTFPNLDWLDMIPTTLRSPVPEIDLRMRFATNPSGRSHNKVAGRYRIKSWSAGVPFVPDNGGLLRCHLFGNVLENESLVATGYLDTLRAIEEPNKRRAHSKGDWAVVAGGIIDDIFRRDAHVIPMPESIPAHWPLSMSYDHGEGHPYAVLYWATSPGESLEIDGEEIHFPRHSKLLIGEIFGAVPGDDKEGLRHTVPEIAASMRQYEAGHPLLSGRRFKSRIADGAIFQKKNKDDVARQFEREGFAFQPSWKGPGSREAGLSQVRSMLREAAKDQPEGPGLWISQECKHWLRIVPSMPRDEKNPDDTPKVDGDDLYDCTRYGLLMGKPDRVGQRQIEMVG